MSKFRPLVLVLILGGVWALADQYTKYLAVRDLTHLFTEEASIGERLRLFYTTQDGPRGPGLYHLAKPSVEIIPGFWNHVYVQNPAGAFGLLSGAPQNVRRGIFTGVAILASIGILWMATQSYGRGALLARGCLGLVLGGAVGNLVDRLVHGYVIDFIDWYATIGDRSFHWPAFNLADVGIVVGVFGLLIMFNLHRAPEEQAGSSECQAADAKEGAKSGG